MPDLSIDVTNACNRDCVHCLRDKVEQREHIQLDVFEEVLDQAKDLGIKHIGLTGGEATLHPAWSDLLQALSERKMKFSVVSNGKEFRQKTLPTLIIPSVKRHLDCVCFSLDGACEKSHDVLRGQNSFIEVVEAANLCKLKGLPFSFKTVVSNANKAELAEIAIFATKLGAIELSYLILVPTPRLLEADLIPSYKEMRKIHSYISGSIQSSLIINVIMEGSWGDDGTLFQCNAYKQSFAVDHLGNLMFCCNLSHVCNGEKPSTLGREFISDIKEQGLKKGIVGHYELLAEFTKSRLSDKTKNSGLYRYPCLWCLDYFGKLECVKKYSDHPLINELFTQT